MSHSSSHLIIGSKSSFCALFLLSQLIVATPAIAATSMPESIGQGAEAVMLIPGRTLRQKIGGSEVHAFLFNLDEKQFARVLVKQQGADVVVTIFDMEGKNTMVDRPNGSRGRETISFIAARRGTYRLEVRTLDRTAPRGSYEINVDEIRQSTPRDESRLAAEQAVTEGETLRARKTAASLPQSLERFSQAIDLWRALDEPYEAAVALYGRCLTHRQVADNWHAVQDCTDSLKIMLSIGDSFGESAARTGRGWAYIYLGEPNEALADFTGSLHTSLRIDDKQGQSLDLYGMGWAKALLGEADKAIDYFQQSIRLLDELHDPRGKAIRLGSIGDIYRRLNQPLRALEYLNSSLHLARDVGSDVGGTAEILTSLGWCRFSMGHLNEAQDCFIEALAMRRAQGDRTGEAITLLGLAHVEREQGSLRDACLHAESALEVVESIRALVPSPPLRWSFFALAQDYYEFYVDLLMRMNSLSSSRGHAIAALEINERARARGLLDLLQESGTDVREGVPAQLLERERSLRTKLNAAASYQRQLLIEPHTRQQAVSASKEVDELSSAFNVLEAQIHRASPQYAAFTYPETLSAASIQREITDANTLLLEYAIGKERSYLWVVSSTDITPYELPARQVIETVAMRVRLHLLARDLPIPDEASQKRRGRLAQADAQYYSSARDLSRILLEPAAAKLEKDKRLIIVAPGALQFIPFAALPSPGTSAKVEEFVPLVEKHEIVLLPSASTIALLRRDRPQRPSQAPAITILADPVFWRSDERFASSASSRRDDRVSDPPAAAPISKTRSIAGSNGLPPFELNPSTVMEPHDPEGTRAKDAGKLYRVLPRLFRTRWEAEQIAALVPPGKALLALDFAANRETVTSPAVSTSRIVHVATHAIIDDAHPELSGIVLSMYDRGGNPQDGFLRAHDIYDLRLTADLVVLSACRTALGRDIKGEGLIGMARGFMYAGAPRVIGSLWSTDDKATAELMVQFYRKMFAQNLTPAAALRAAQLEMLKDKRWRSPFYWAGFTLQGEWR